MTIDGATFGLNIFLLIGLLILGAAALVLIVGLWTGANWAVWRRRQHRAEQDYRRARYHADGTPRPPHARGICDVCGTVHDTVYYLSDGRKLCLRHREEQQPTERPD